MSKHAYLIIAHNEFEVLQALVKAIDDMRNDIYIHIDKKIMQLPILECKHAGLFFTKKRIDVRWGDYSMVETELILFEEASSHIMYDYYHLLSGVDFPFKSQDYIHQFCAEYYGKEFIGFSKMNNNELYWRTQHYFLFSKSFQSKNILTRIIRFLAIKFQDFLKYRRTSLEIRKGPQWCSLTHPFVQYLLMNRALIQNTFHHTYCPDEMFIQTICWNSNYRNKVYNIEDEFEGCKRYIKWVNGELLPLTIDDIEIIENSTRWFARKLGKNLIHVRSKI